MSVRTYNPSVRVGNWNEDICLEEDKIKDFKDKQERGELLIQKSTNLLSTILKKVDMEVVYDGYLHFGNHVCLHNPMNDIVLAVNISQSKAHEAKAIEGPCGVSGAKLSNPCIRNIFVITSVDEARDGDILKYGQHFCLQTLEGPGGQLTLQSDRSSFMKSAKKSRKQDVQLSNEISYLSHWRCLCYDPQERLETEGLPVPANTKLLLNHCKTNQNLAALGQFTFITPFGRELEVVTFTQLNSHKAEEPVNHWQFLTETIENIEDESNYIPPQPVETQPLSETHDPVMGQQTERPLEDNRPLLEGPPPEIPTIYGNLPDGNTQ